MNPNEDEVMTVDIDLDGGTVTCSIVTILTVDAKDYIVLMPLDEHGENEDGEVWIYGYQDDPEHPEEEPILTNLVDEEEYEKVSDAYDMFLDDVEFDELIEQED
ncbi:MAG: DUF1292 domain-containing protein [Lachnospiraceae bacterium]|jgi:uncharacterized protein YrzB (UPF0473 family)|nr:DUF1292 domain-containing protein [Lachnospiraceae bacterium]